MKLIITALSVLLFSACSSISETSEKLLAKTNVSDSNKTIEISTADEVITSAQGSYFVFEEKDESIGFASTFYSNLYESDSDVLAGHQGLIIVLNDAFEYLIDSHSPISDEANEFHNNGYNLTLIGCGKAIKKMQQYVASGKASLLPNAVLIESCDSVQARIDSLNTNDSWYQVSL